MSFIDSHREDLGIEPIYRELAVAPSSYHEHARRLADPDRRPAHARRIVGFRPPPASPWMRWSRQSMPAGRGRKMA